MSVLNLREYKKEFAKDKTEETDVIHKQCIILNFYEYRNKLAYGNKKYLNKIAK